MRFTTASKSLKKPPGTASKQAYSLGDIGIPNVFKNSVYTILP